MLRGGTAFYRAQAILAIKAERRRQIEQEGWTPEHDNAHGASAGLLRAGECYFRSALGYYPDGQVPERWPWEAEWWKPQTIERDLVRAGALFEAEEDRLHRTVGIGVQFPVRSHIAAAIHQLSLLYRHDDEGVPF